jgi:2-dehydropantoate 2-reductase
MKHIAVIGLGGVGGFFGARLARFAETSPEYSVHFIARGAHLEAIRRDGLTLDAQDGMIHCRPASAGDRIADLPELDYCLVCVKGYDLPAVLTQLEPRLKDDTVILPLLNGVDIFERVRAQVKKGYLHPACVYIGTHIEKPGTVQQRGAMSTILLGHDPGCAKEDRSILSLFDAAGISYGWKDDPFVEIWTKYIFIAPFGLVTAESGMTIDEVLHSAAHLEKAKAIMAEIVALGRKQNIALPESIIEDTLVRAAKFPAGTRTSFQRDFSLADRPDERDLFGGSILRLGASLGIPTPVTAAIYETLSARKPLKA